ncbi:MAG: archease [Pseudomonadota bacterium]|nr:archease [Pseudomonadota bacterium]
MPYDYLEDMAVADVAFAAWDADLEKTFVAAAEALLNVMVEDIATVRPVETRAIALENDALDLLLFDFLQEIVFYKDAELLLLRVAQLRIGSRDGAYALRAEGRGETIDAARHAMVVDVKAVTLHRFALEQTGDGWRATVVLDI